MEGKGCLQLLRIRVAAPNDANQPAGVRVGMSTSGIRDVTGDFDSAQMHLKGQHRHNGEV